MNTPHESSTDSTTGTSPWVDSADDQTFAAAVVERSKKTPVVVDFWASWCGPCRTLGPILENVAAQYNGRFVLVKVDTEQAPEASMQFNVRAIPAVFGMVGGEAVDFFEGVLPEPQIRDWIDRVLTHGEILEVQRQEESDPAAAEAKYRQLVDELSDEPSGERSGDRAARLQIGLARVLLELKREDEAKQIIHTLEHRGFLEPEAQKVKAQLELQSGPDDDFDQLRAEAEQNPNDFPLQLRLARALASAGQHQPAMEICLDLVEKDRRGAGEEARQLMVDIFRVLGEDSELVSKYQRKLSMALY